MSLFNGKAILYFHSSGLLQGHCIDMKTHSSPYSLGGKRLEDYVDPHHNDCEEPYDYYSVMIRCHEDNGRVIRLILRKPNDNDAGNLSTRRSIQSEEYSTSNDNGIDPLYNSNNMEEEEHALLFETDQFITGTTALKLISKYFPRKDTVAEDEDDIVCIGTMQLTHKPPSSVP
ncbi:hypothetical protein BDB01DRAFT_795043 [Pilobolus umbonatus]|nr:hypothetical protein BDB01DRAFT_795043 [Pilobolus umbonatus]